MVAVATAEKQVHAAEGATHTSAAVFFALGGDLRYLAHLDEVRMLVRTLHRAGWPLAYSLGFNPLPRVKLPLPRRVAMASACELALVELDATRSARSLHESLAAALPGDCTLDRVVLLTQRVRPQPRRAHYEVDLSDEHARQAAARIDTLLEASTAPVERDYGPAKPARMIDIRPCIETTSLDGRTLSISLVYVDQHSARPAEVLTALQLPADVYNHCVRRTAVTWNIEFAGTDRWPANPERTTVGQEESDDTETKNHVA